MSYRSRNHEPSGHTMAYQATELSHQITTLAYRATSLSCQPPEEPWSAVVAPAPWPAPDALVRLFNELYTIYNGAN